VVTDKQGNPQATLSPTGLAPSNIISAYGFPGVNTAGQGLTIAIVDAYDDPNAASDLNTFSSQFGLPNCNSTNPCFTKVNQTGGSSYPQSNSGWDLEISLDIEWAHAIAPAAHILLVEASSANFSDLLAAEDYAAAHATFVSNSWGASEFSGETGYDSHFVHSGVSFFVAAGDAGLPAEYPSSSPNVISVGGTTLNYSSGAFVSETGWSSGGGGCSAYETATSAQSTFNQYAQVNCGGKRATPDVALDADPNSGVSVYDSVPYSGQSGWFVVGGTSASTPMWAAASADAGVVVDAQYVYGNAINFRDIISGNNGAPCLTGFDLCSGRGSWLFSSSGTTTTTSPSSTTSTTTPTTTTTIGSSGSMTVGVTAGPESSKGPSHKVPLTVSVTSSSSPVSGASVALSVYSGGVLNGKCVGTLAATGTGTTGSTGSLTFTFSTKKTGQWCASATASAAGYASASGITVFNT
jgi:subtilase family serine protease